MIFFELFILTHFNKKITYLFLKNLHIVLLLNEVVR